MKSVERIDINKKRPTPVHIKLIILAAVIFGIWVRSCWIKKQPFTLRIYNIVVSEVTPTSIEVKFNVSNPNDIELTKAILIKASNADGDIIASRITKITCTPKSKKTYLKMLNTLKLPVREISDVENVTIEIYTPKIFE